jgi:hypothetical protein
MSRIAFTLTLTALSAGIFAKLRSGPELSTCPNQPTCLPHGREKHRVESSGISSVGHISLERATNERDWVEDLPDRNSL